MRTSILVSIAVVAGSITSAASGAIVYDNQSSLPGSGTLGIVTTPGGGFGGGDLSALTTPDTTFGFGVASPNIRLCDDFTVPAGQSWTLTGANMFGYLTNSTVPTNTAATVRFFSTDPLGTTGGTVVGGDTTTNVQTANAFYGPTAIYRALSTSPLNAARQVQQVTTAFAPIVLGPGTYWIDFQLTGISFVPSMTLTPGAVTGNARQVTTIGGNYAATVDGTTAKGVPFQLEGSIPAPSSFALLGLGGLVAARRRRN